MKGQSSWSEIPIGTAERDDDSDGGDEAKTVFVMAHVLVSDSGAVLRLGRFPHPHHCAFVFLLFPVFCFGHFPGPSTRTFYEPSSWFGAAGRDVQRMAFGTKGEYWMNGSWEKI